MHKLTLKDLLVEDIIDGGLWKYTFDYFGNIYYLNENNILCFQQNIDTIELPKISTKVLSWDTELKRALNIITSSRTLVKNFTEALSDFESQKHPNQNPFSCQSVLGSQDTFENISTEFKIYNQDQKIEIDLPYNTIILASSPNDCGVLSFSPNKVFFNFFIIQSNIKAYALEKNSLRISSGGLKCSKCKEFYPYAEANQSNGTLICYSCRN